MAKHSLEELDNVPTVTVSLNAKVHGVVACMSLTKHSKPCSYFDGKVTDGKSSMRVFLDWWGSQHSEEAG